MKVTIQTPWFAYREPFVIAGHVFLGAETVRVELEQGGVRGRGEAQGIYYLDETPESMAAQLEAVAPRIEAGLNAETIQSLLPPGGARFALDSAWWDLQAKTAGRRVWELFGLDVAPVTTVCTISIGEPEAMAAAARSLDGFSQLKVKLDGDRIVERISAVREARPDAILVIDANQAWTLDVLEAVLPELARFDVKLVEQPLPRGEDEALEDFSSPLPLCGDESFLNLSELSAAAARYDVLNIKLDKCGGLTEAMQIVEAARQHGKRLMVGNMAGSSLGMAPAFLPAQFCDFVDLDGPTMLVEDVAHGLSFGPGGVVSVPDAKLWG